MFKKVLSFIVSLAILYSASITVFADNDTKESQEEPSMTVENTDNENNSNGSSDYTETGEINSDSVEEEDKQEELHKKILDNLVYSGDLDETEQFLVNITNPQEYKQIVFKSSYVFFGFTEESDITIVIAKKDSVTGEYQYYENVDGESYWDKDGILYLSEFELKNGENEIKLIAYKTVEIEQLDPGVNLQVNYFSITFLEETIKNKIINSTFPNIIDLFKQYNDLTDNDVLFNFSETNEFIE